MSAIAHDAKTKAGVGAENGGKAGSVVANGKQQVASVFGQSNFDIFGFGMAHGVGDGLLGDFIHLTDGVGVEGGCVDSQWNRQAMSKVRSTCETSPSIAE